MSYQALARKWRPKKFADLVGQDHVVRALTNALERGRLHHAYLLTGTRGVGKTTIARLLAKSLNCATGVTATPCGVCPACIDIDAGRFVDLLELDAASNTGIDNMREILDNARYAPTVGRYKVYLIDEVHMLSKAAFNSMLKTLEEPPEHVKFVLATTDPQKIPITVLSRCLQFNLKPLGPELVAQRLTHILEAEGVAHDTASVGLIARAAQGSMRDGLSLLDQAIAFGGGSLEETAVRAMLGVVDRDFLYRIVDALASDDGAALLDEARALAERGLSLSSALDELASLFHRMAVAQAVPDAAAQFDDGERVMAAAARFTPEAVQLCYQICVQGRVDLPLAPDETTGFAMTLLRLLAFEPGKGSADAAPTTGGARGERPASAAPARAAAATASTRTAAPAPGVSNVASLRAAADSPSRVNAPSRVEPSTPAVPMPAPETWPTFVAGMKLTGMAAQLAAQSELRAVNGNALTLALPTSHKHLADRSYADKLKAALEAAVGRRLLLAFEVGDTSDTSLAAQERRQRAEAKAKGEQAFRDEPFVRELITRFDGRVKAETVEPLPASTPNPTQDSAS